MCGGNCNIATFIHQASGPWTGNHCVSAWNVWLESRREEHRVYTFPPDHFIVSMQQEAEDRDAEDNECVFFQRIRITKCLKTGKILNYTNVCMYMIKHKRLHLKNLTYDFRIA